MHNKGLTVTNYTTCNKSSRITSERSIYYRPSLDLILDRRASISWVMASSTLLHRREIGWWFRNVLDPASSSWRFSQWGRFSWWSSALRNGLPYNVRHPIHLPNTHLETRLVFTQMHTKDLAMLSRACFDWAMSELSWSLFKMLTLILHNKREWDDGPHTQIKVAIVPKIFGKSWWWFWRTLLHQTRPWKDESKKSTCTSPLPGDVCSASRDGILIGYQPIYQCYHPSSTLYLTMELTS